jgi:hypothetical protein
MPGVILNDRPLTSTRARTPLSRSSEDAMSAETSYILQYVIYNKLILIGGQMKQFISNVEEDPDQ